MTTFVYNFTIHVFFKRPIELLSNADRIAIQVL